MLKGEERGAQGLGLHPHGTEDLPKDAHDDDLGLAFWVGGPAGWETRGSAHSQALIHIC